MSTSFTNRGVKLYSLKKIKAYMLCLYNHNINKMNIGKLKTSSTKNNINTICMIINKIKTLHYSSKQGNNKDSGGGIHPLISFISFY